MVWLQGTCSELLEEPHAGAEELVGAAQVAKVGPTQRQEQPQGWQVCLQHRLCQGCSNDQITYKVHTQSLSDSALSQQ